MPIYEFECENCRSRFETLVSINRENEVRCPSCQGSEIKKCVSAFGISGSAKTGSRSSSCSSCTSKSCSTCS